jgi:hypothetical protein
MAMKLNKNLRRVLVTVALVSTSFALGTQNGEQNILNRWENRWFESDWYDTRSIEDFLYDKDYSIELGE